MQNLNITQVHGITPEQLKEIILNDVRAEFLLMALNFQPKIQPILASKEETE